MTLKQRLSRINLNRLNRVLPRISVALLAIALVPTFLWLWTGDGKWEPVVTLLGIFAAILTFFIDPWVKELSERRDSLHALIWEINHNIKLLNHNQFDPEKDLGVGVLIYPRLISPSLESALSSGLFNGEKHKTLRQSMLNTTLQINYFNSFMFGFEIQAKFASPQEYARAHKLLKHGAPLEVARKQFREILLIIGTDYSQDTEVELMENQSVLAFQRLD